MYDSFLVRSDSLSNFEENGKVAGFKFSVRIANYRGMFLSSQRLLLRGGRRQLSPQRAAPRGKRQASPQL